MQKLLVFCLVVGLACCSVDRVLHENSDPDLTISDNPLVFTEQLVDHLDPNVNDTFAQRYWVYDQSFKGDKKVVFLYICGEAECTGIRSDRKWPLVLAEKLNGMVLVLEHRYYGQSIPKVQQYHTENLRYLTVDNALADLAYFQNWIIENQKHGVTKLVPWISIGGSYAGALSAWYRVKYPFMTIGALSSSGVVHSIYEFTSYDFQIYNVTQVVGGDCASKIRQLNDYVEDQLNQPEAAAKILGDFNATKLTNKEFLFYYADIFAGRVQYGDAKGMCSEFDFTSDPKELYKTVLKYAADQQLTCYDYGTYYLSNATFYESTRESGRAWTYQWCSEFGWLQTYNPGSGEGNEEQRARAKSVDAALFNDLCAKSFGDIFQTQAMVDNTNLHFGGDQLEATNLIMTNGYQDPWQGASVTTPRPNINVITIDGNGHCSDLYTPQDTDNDSLKKARDSELTIFATWISIYYDKMKNQGERVDL